MMLPMPRRFGQEGAQYQRVGQIALLPRAFNGIMSAVGCAIPAGSCNSVFRYPSPSGWFCRVPSESPVFSEPALQMAVAQKAMKVQCWGYENIGNTSEGVRPSKVSDTQQCVSKQQFLAYARSPRLAPVATISVSKRSSALARAPQRQLSLAATLRRARSSAAQPTSSIAKNSPTSADAARATATAAAPASALRYSTARQSSPKMKPSTRCRGRVAFLLPKQAVCAA